MLCCLSLHRPTVTGETGCPFECARRAVAKQPALRGAHRALVKGEIDAFDESGLNCRPQAAGMEPLGQHLTGSTQHPLLRANESSPGTNLLQLGIDKIGRDHPLRFAAIGRPVSKMGAQALAGTAELIISATSFPCSLSCAC